MVSVGEDGKVICERVGQKGCWQPCGHGGRHARHSGCARVVCDEIGLEAGCLPAPEPVREEYGFEAWFKTYEAVHPDIKMDAACMAAAYAAGTLNERSGHGKVQ